MPIPVENVVQARRRNRRLVRSQRRRVVRPRHTLPPSFHTDASSGRGYRPNSVRPQPAPKPYRLPKQFKTEQAAHQTTPRERAAANRVARRVKRRVDQRQRAAVRRYGIKALERKQRSVVRDFGKLYLSDPENYRKQERQAEERRKSWFEKVGDIGGQGQRAISEAAEGVKKGTDFGTKQVLTHTKQGQAYKGLKRAGVPLPDPAKVAREAVDIVANTPSGAYMAGAAAFESGKQSIKRGHPSTSPRADKLIKDFTKTSALAPAVEGAFKNLQGKGASKEWGEAAKRAKARPLTTALELSGTKAVIGRSLGAGARAAPSRRVRQIGSTKGRAPKRLYDPVREPTHHGGPMIERDYSRDLINKGIQVAADRHRRHKRPDRADVDEGVRLVPSNRLAPERDRPPIRQRLKRRVDTRVSAQHRAAEDRRREAELESKRAERERRQRDIARLRKEEPEGKRPTGAPSMRAVEREFKAAGGKLPVVVRPFRTEESLAKRRGGYAGIRRDPATGREYHLVYYNPRHGPGARNEAVWFELGRALRNERERDFNPTTKMDEATYRSSPGYLEARRFADEKMDTDLMEEPPLATIRSKKQALQALAQEVRQQLNAEKRHADPARAKEIRELEALSDRRLLGAIEQSRRQEFVGKRLDAFEDENRALIADEFGVSLPRESRFFSSPKSAEAAAVRFGNPDLVPFRIAEGRYTLMPRVVRDRFAEHQKMNQGPFGPGHAADRGTAMFKDVVLTTSSPARWLGGNVTDLATRSLMAGLTPLDVARGWKGHRVLKKEGIQGEQAAASMFGGGMYGAADALSPGATLRRARPFAPPGSHLPRRVAQPAAYPARMAWRGWKRIIYTSEHFLERLPQYGAAGKAMRRDIGRRHETEDGQMKTSLKTFLKVSDEQVTDYFKGVAHNRAREARLQKAVEDVIGRWGKVSPKMRVALQAAPFVQWLGAATRYVLITLPVHHPIKTGIMAGIAQMTEKERTRLGLSYFAPMANRASDFQMGMLPLEVGRNKYGPTVEGIRTARMMSFGTAAGVPGNLPEFLLPQIAGPYNTLRGQAYTGEPLVYPDYAPEHLRGLPIGTWGEDKFPGKAEIGLGALIEGTVPFASAFRRAHLEGGASAEPWSTILTPALRPKFDYETGTSTPGQPGPFTAGLKEWALPYAPKSRLYTLGASRDISESRIQSKRNEKFRQQRLKKTGKFGFGNAPPEESLGFGSPVTPKRRKGEETRYGF